MTQVVLAETVKNTQTFISKIERGERRIDVVEFIELCEAMDVDPAAAFQELIDRRLTPRGGGRKLSGRSP